MNVKWTQAIIAELIALRTAGWANADIARKLDTTKWAINSKIRQLGLAKPRKFSHVCIDCDNPMPASDKNAKRCRNCYNIAAVKGVATESYTNVSDWIMLPDGVRMRRVGDVGMPP